MTKITQHLPPSPNSYRAQQIVMAGLLAAMIFAVLGLFVLALLIPAPLIGLMSLFMAFLTAPVAMLLSISPPLIIDEDGLTIAPFWGAPQRIAWDEIVAMQPYPLLPQPEQETEWRIMRGRKRYRAAEGYMLIIPRLPMRYRVAGFFAGVRGKPLIAFTNRAHSDYDTLLQRVQAHISS